MESAASRKVILYTGSLCHLCHEAKAVVYPLLPAGCSFSEINIDADPALQQRYGFSIPVVTIVDSDGCVIAEKKWPFTQGQVKRMLAS